MNVWKGLGYAIAGAVVGAGVWVALISVTGWGLWILAPIVGGCAGFGMMRASQMRGGRTAGVLAASVTFVAILGARGFVVSRSVDELLTLDEEGAYAILVDETAEGMAEQGVEVYGDEDYTDEVYAAADASWSSWSPEERAAFAASRQEEISESALVLTPLALLFDFGIIGTVCAALAVGTAFKTGSATLERSVVENGLATDGAQVAAVSARLRAGETVSVPPPGGGLFSIPPQSENKPVKPIKVPGYSATGPTPPAAPAAKEAA